jgi:hypothetical protein
MPRQNRVTPFGEIVAYTERGTYFGNRGVLHDKHGAIRRPWEVTRWIVCLLEFKGRWRPAMTPGHYTGLFFLDEATALAAGHRPCAECRRVRFEAFRTAWDGSGKKPTAGELDSRLHAERVNDNGAKRISTMPIAALADGVMVRCDDRAHLVFGDRLLLWTPAGYEAGIPRPTRGMVDVLTPPSTVAVIRGGYEPDFHPTAKR